MGNFGAGIGSGIGIGMVVGNAAGHAAGEKEIKKRLSVLLTRLDYQLTDKKGNTISYEELNKILDSKELRKLGKRELHRSNKKSITAKWRWIRNIYCK